MQSPRILQTGLMTAILIVGLIQASCGEPYTTSNNNQNNTVDCDGGGCVGDLALGEACTAPGECASGFCVDDVCCDGACDDACEACLAAATGGEDGACAAVTAGTDPDGECDDEGASSCGANGTGCNGDSASPECNLYDDTAACGDNECTAGVATTVGYCDGSGTCEAGSTTNCAPFACNSAGTDCLTTCTGPGDCDAGSYCDGTGACVAKQAQGSGCSDDVECASGFCVDDLCCDRICDATCEACAAATTGGTDGTCGAITASTDPDTECTATGPATCGANGTGCNGNTASPGCNVYDNTTICSTASCTAGMLTTAGLCDGAGTCGASAPTSCAPYQCNAGSTACLASCTSHNDCDASAYCDGTGSCAPKLADGATCAIGLQCLSGNCPATDGVCCDTACDATCEACLASKTGGTDGVCGAVTTGADPDNECTATLASTCGASGNGCNGNAGNPDCILYDNATVCATAGCNGSVMGGDGLCNGAGLCVQSGAVNCDPYMCNAGGSACLTTCTAQTDCITGFYCDGGGVCQAKLTDGAVCSVGLQCLSGSCPAADGVCCATACGGACEACLAAKTGGTDGTCGPITANTDPDTECGADVCNGAGSCRCADGQLNGSESDVDCGGGVCNGCGPGLACNAGTDCTTGNCPTADGVCCNTPCSGTCEACLAAKTGGTDGTCSAVTAATDPDTECGADVCNGFGACRCTDSLLNGAETDVDCGGGVCPTCGDGQICAAGTDCTSGNCPADDNLCCDTACGALCESCLGALNGNADGVCDSMLVNTDPDNDCGDSESCNSAGACYDPCPTVSCYLDADCTPGATGDLCVDPANDCLRATCEGAVAGTLVESGAPMTANFSAWQSGDDESSRGAGRWYCNASLPVTDDGVLTNWEIYVDSHAGAGESTQLLVIRCTGGSGGSGPAHSGCTRVGSSPVLPIATNGLHTGSLAGSSQLDSATADPLGIVAQTGDLICVDVEYFEIGIDCNGGPSGGGCPGPDFNTQYGSSLSTASEPFSLTDSSYDGTLMIKAYGSTPSVAGTCADVTPEPDTTACTDNGGDTCCSGACITGPGGPGTCN